MMTMTALPMMAMAFRTMRVLLLKVGSFPLGDLLQMPRKLLESPGNASCCAEATSIPSAPRLSIASPHVARFRESCKLAQSRLVCWDVDSEGTTSQKELGDNLIIRIIVLYPLLLDGYRGVHQALQLQLIQPMLDEPGTAHGVGLAVS